MTWEETIVKVRKKKAYQEVIKYAYLDENIFLNVERFRESAEWRLTLELIKEFKGGTLKILDMGCGNGIAAISFALLGHSVVAVDPDKSDTVGLGAVAKLKEFYGLSNLSLKATFAETLTEEVESFDLIYCRQSMHHALDLEKFILNCAKYLKKEGILLTARDHVIFNKADKKWFLKAHPFHSLYGGENAYLPDEYERAMTHASFQIVKKLKHFDSAINYYPITEERYNQLLHLESEKLRQRIIKRIGFIGRLDLFFWLYKQLIFDPADLIDEKKIPGRMYTYAAIKK